LIPFLDVHKCSNSVKKKEIKMIKDLIKGIKENISANLVEAVWWCRVQENWLHCCKVPKPYFWNVKGTHNMSPFSIVSSF